MPLARYVVSLVRATRPERRRSGFLKKYVNYGGSIRAAQFIACGQGASARPKALSRDL
jgi:MoxR-like ATPase